MREFSRTKKWELVMHFSGRLTDLAKALGCKIAKYVWEKMRG